MDNTHDATAPQTEYARTRLSTIFHVIKLQREIEPWGDIQIQRAHTVRPLVALRKKFKPMKTSL
jgi:hypothetical protein